jgi:ribonuclease P protein component
LNESGKYPFSRLRRLDGSHAYAAVFAYRCSVSGQWFQVYAKPAGEGLARLGVVVSKRIMKRAVARNYYKRLAREVFRHECATVSGVDFVVRPRAPVAVPDAPACRAELGDLLRRSAGQCRRRLAATTR